MSEPKNIKINNAYRIGLLGGLGVLTAVALGNALFSIAGIITSIITAFFITLGLEPLIQKLEKVVKRRGYAIGVVALGLVGFIALLITLVLPTLIAQTGLFIQNLPQLLKEFLALPWIESLDARFGGTISSAISAAGDFVVDSRNWPNLLGGVVQVGITLFNGLIAISTITILTLYFMSALPSMKRVGIELVAKSSRTKVGHIVDLVIASVGRYVMGQVTVASINASFVFLLLLSAGVPFAVVLAFIDFLLVLIPIIGGISAAAIIILISAATMPIETTFIIAIVILAYLQIEAYLIAPRIMKRAVDVPAALVVVAALSGGALLGILGSLLAIPVAATLLIVLREVWIPKQDQL